MTLPSHSSIRQPRPARGNFARTALCDGQLSLLNFGQAADCRLLNEHFILSRNRRVRSHRAQRKEENSSTHDDRAFHDQGSLSGINSGEVEAIEQFQAWDLRIKTYLKDVLHKARRERRTPGFIGDC
jgi:hypothetical protein